MKDLLRRFRFALLAVAVLLLCGSVPAMAQEDLEYPEGLDVPYVPTPIEVVKGMLNLAKVKKGDLVIDLGCGDGRIVVEAASSFGARGIGYDLNPTRIKEANENAKKAGVENQTKFILKNLFEAEIKDASVITLYLLPSVNEKLKPRLMEELKPGTRIISHSFSMPEWEPKETVEVSGRTLYLWVIPEKKKAND